MANGLNARNDKSGITAIFGVLAAICTGIFTLSIPIAVTAQQLPTQNWWETGKINPVIHMIVNKAEQRVSVYADGIPIVKSNVSTGKNGYETPGGIFSILSKNRFHYSNLYSRAPMPFMQRLTWSGIALHGSNSVPDYPASHGCIRLPGKFASKLFKYTQKGAQVIVTGLDIRPQRFYSPNMFEIAGMVESLPLTGSETTTISDTREPLRILITRNSGRQRLSEIQALLNELQYAAGDVDGWMGPQTGRAIAAFQQDYRHRVSGALNDALLAQLYRASGKGTPKNGHLYVRRNLKPLFDLPVVISDEETPLGTHHITAIYPQATDVLAQSPAKPFWLSMTIEQTGWVGMAQTMDNQQNDGIKLPTGKSMLDKLPLKPSNAVQAFERITLSAKLKQQISAMITPGSTVVIADKGISRETGLGTDFIVLTRRNYLN